MSNSNNILVLESNPELRKQIKSSLAAIESIAQIEDATESEMKRLSSPQSPYSVFIFSARDLSINFLDDLPSDEHPAFICLGAGDELTEIGDRIKQSGIVTLSKNRDGIKQLPALVERLIQQRNERILLKYLFNENKTSLIGKLFSGFAHNISAPLTGILGYAEIVRANHPEIAEMKSIITQAKRIDTIIRTLVLKNMKLENKENSLINLNELIKNEINLLQANMVFKHEINPKVELAEKLPKFPANYSDISHSLTAFMSFCTSAVKKANSKELGIKTSFDENSIIFELKYQGLPFPEEAITQVLDEGNLFPQLFASDELENWLTQNFSVCLAYQTLISSQAQVEIRQRMNKTQTISIKFPRNENINHDRNTGN